ncbi:hypothetical protein M758_1G149100 [Ceratodon purpureus]|nr:hypothetical protein M758_1G149100 [Ceratodon purpureus]
MAHLPRHHSHKRHSKKHHKKPTLTPTPLLNQQTEAHQNIEPNHTYSQTILNTKYKINTSTKTQPKQNNHTYTHNADRPPPKPKPSNKLPPSHPELQTPIHNQKTKKNSTNLPKPQTSNTNLPICQLQ